MIVRNLDIEAYHAKSYAISKSGLTEFAKSPAIYYARHLDPNRPPRPAPTPAMVLGTMTHCAVLEPGQFDSRYVIAPKVDRRTKAGKEDWAAFCDSLLPGQEAADPAMVEQSRAMAASLLRVQSIRELLSAGEPEVSAFWTDEATGVECRCRPDWVKPAGDGVILADAKTCIDASPAGFAKTVANFGYDLQAALYTDGYEAAAQTKVHGFVFLAVEKEYPFAAAAYMLDESDLDRARRKYRGLLARYAECLRSNTWPGYTGADEIQLLTLPAWATKEE